MFGCSDVRMFGCSDVHDGDRITAEFRHAAVDVGISFPHTAKSEPALRSERTPIECLRAYNRENFIKFLSSVLYGRIRSMQKLCHTCNLLLPTTSFSKRSASHDGLKPRCKSCDSAARSISYYLDPAFRSASLERAKRNKQARFTADPAYKKAFNLWCSTRRRTRIPEWVSITDFLPVCHQLLLAGEGYELDHIVPLNGAIVSGLHVPSNVQVVRREANQRKRNNFDIESL